MIKKLTIKEIIARIGLVVGAIVLSVLVAEAMSRFIMPLQVGVSQVDADGKPAVVMAGGSPIPSITYFMQSNEFNARVTHSKFGHRGPMVTDNPDVIFLGDSFTFGHGLSDEETFASLYCNKTGQSCANLGWPGTGTAQQLDRLDAYLTEFGWRPRQVKLFVLAMTAYLGAGNDLADNLQWEAKTARRVEKGAVGKASTAVASKNSSLDFLDWAASQRRLVLKNSNLARLAMFIAGPTIRSKLNPGAHQADLDRALEITARHFTRLDETSKKYGFDYQIYIIHPMQDLINQTHTITEGRLRKISPFPEKLISTANPLLSKGGVDQLYFSYDGHLNPMGARAVSEFLISQSVN